MNWLFFEFQHLTLLALSGPIKPVHQTSQTNLSRQAVTSMEKSPLEFEPVQNLECIFYRLFIAIKVFLCTQIEHTQVDRVEAQFKLKDYNAR